MSDSGRTPMLSGFAGDGLRFLLAGGANTLLTFALYQLLLFIASPSVAYALSWLFGLAFVVVVYPAKVFAGAQKGGRARLYLGASYVAMFLIGLATLQGLSTIGVPPRIAIILVMAVTTLANFLLGRLIFRRPKSGQPGS